VTGDSFIAVMENIALRHVLWNSFPVWWCTTPLLPSCSYLSGRGVSWSLVMKRGIHFLALLFSSFDYSGFFLLEICKWHCLSWKSTKFERFAESLTQFDVFPASKTMLVMKFFRAISRLIAWKNFITSIDLQRALRMKCLPIPVQKLNVVLVCVVPLMMPYWDLLST
jgi:hypothetical protein